MLEFSAIFTAYADVEVIADYVIEDGMSIEDAVYGYIDMCDSDIEYSILTQHFEEISNAVQDFINNID